MEMSEVMSMHDARELRARRIAAEALRFPTGQREVFINTSCNGDSVLRERITVLIAEANPRDLPLPSGRAEIIDRLINNGTNDNSHDDGPDSNG